MGSAWGGVRVTGSSTSSSFCPLPSARGLRCRGAARAPGRARARRRRATAARAPRAGPWRRDRATAPRQASPHAAAPRAARPIVPRARGASEPHARARTVPSPASSRRTPAASEPGPCAVPPAPCCQGIRDRKAALRGARLRAPPSTEARTDHPLFALSNGLTTGSCPFSVRVMPIDSNPGRAIYSSL